MIHPRVALASGLAGVAGAGLLLSGRLQGSVVLCALLIVGARAAALSADGDADAVRALARQSAFVPVWVLVVAAAALRAGDPDLASVRGAHAVAGVALAHGGVLLVLGSWLAAAAAVSAVASGLGAGRVFVTRDAPSRLEALVLGAEVLFVTTLFAGPHIDEVRDAFVWAAGLIGVGSAAWLVRGRTWWPRFAPIAVLVAASGLALVAIGDPL